MVFNATFNKISVISLQSILLVEETEYPEKTTISDLWQVSGFLHSGHPAKDSDMCCTFSGRQPRSI
jgi:hypothetical protein